MLSYPSISGLRICYAIILLIGLLYIFLEVVSVCFFSIWVTSLLLQTSLEVIISCIERIRTPGDHSSKFDLSFRRNSGLLSKEHSMIPRYLNETQHSIRCHEPFSFSRNRVRKARTPSRYCTLDVHWLFTRVQTRIRLP